MPTMVCATAVCSCSMGTTPATLVVTSQTKWTAMGLPVATINDKTFIPPVATFGAPCKPLTAAASGVPQPCAPSLDLAWFPGSPKTSILGLPVLTNASDLLCVYGGVITVESPNCTLETL